MSYSDSLRDGYTPRSEELSRLWSALALVCLGAALIALVLLADIEINTNIEWADQTQLFYALTGVLAGFSRNYGKTSPCLVMTLCSPLSCLLS